MELRQALGQADGLHRGKQNRGDCAWLAEKYGRHGGRACAQVRSAGRNAQRAHRAARNAVGRASHDGCGARHPAPDGQKGEKAPPDG